MRILPQKWLEVNIYVVSLKAKNYQGIERLSNKQNHATVCRQKKAILRKRVSFSYACYAMELLTKERKEKNKHNG